MPKYYYTDPIKTTWMLREFGVSCYSVDHKGERCDQDMWNSVAADDFDWKFYIHQDSLGTLEPQFNDLVIIKRKHKNGRKQYIGILQGKSGTAYSVNGKLIDRGEIFHAEIIQRNGKAFFMPEIEVEE